MVNKTARDESVNGGKDDEENRQLQFVLKDLALLNARGYENSKVLPDAGLRNQANKGQG